MLLGLLILIGCQLAGEIISASFNLPIPGPVIGMLLLFCALLIRRGVPQSLNTTAHGFLRYIGLLFVPAGAGISAYLGLLHDYWLVILVASVTSTLAALFLCAALFEIFKKETRDEL